MPTLTVADDVDYYYEDRGAGPALVLIPGWGLNHLIFEGQVYGLHADYRVITLDWRGCGRSSRPATGNTIAQVAQDVSVLLETLDLRDVTLAGWSLGGNVAAECALRQPRVGRLVSVCAGLPKWTDSDGFAIGQSHERVLSWIGDLGRRRGEFLSGFAAGWFKDPHPADAAWMSAQLMDASWFIDDIMRDLARHDMRESLGQLQIPVAYFHGRHDRNAPLALAELCAKLTPGAVLEVFDDSAHTPFMEETAEFNRRLDAFVRASR